MIEVTVGYLVVKIFILTLGLALLYKGHKTNEIIMIMFGFVLLFTCVLTISTDFDIS